MFLNFFFFFSYMRFETPEIKEPLNLRTNKIEKQLSDISKRKSIYN